MMIKNIKNGDIISFIGKEYTDSNGVKHILKSGNRTIDNAIYLRVNAHESGKSKVNAKEFIEDHPHTWNIKDTDLPMKNLRKYKDEYDIF